MSDLQVDGEDERGGGDHGEGLVVGGRLPVLSHRLQKGSVRDEEDDERDEDAVEQADEEVLVVEHRPLLAREVEFGEFQAQFVVHVLNETQKQCFVFILIFFIHFSYCADNQNLSRSDFVLELSLLVSTWSRSPTSRTGKLL